MKISINKIIENLFWLSIIIILFQMQVFPSELTTETYLMIIIIGTLWIICKKCKLSYNIYLVSFGMLIMNFLIHFLFNIESNSINKITLIFAEYLVLLFMYNFLIYDDNFEKFLKIFVITTTISLCIIFILLGENALISRLGHNGSGSIVSYYLFGKAIYKSSNGTATFCCIAVFLCFYYITIKQKKIYTLHLLFLALGVIFTGSRKGLLLLIVITLYSLFIMEKKNLIKKMILIICMPVLFYIILFKIPIIYDLMGERLQSLILNLQGKANINDGNSFNMRMILASKAKEYFYQKPLFGWGLCVFVNNNNGYGPENNYLDILVSSGIIGLISYYNYVIFVIYNMIKKYSKYDEIFRIFCVFNIALLIIDFGTVSYCWLSSTIWIVCFFVSVKKNKQLLNK